MLETKYRPMADLSLLEDNPRQIKADDFQKLCTSIKAHPDYFEARPCILSDRTGELVIIAGNMRYRAAKELGLTQIPTVLMPALTPEREKEIVMRDNISNGGWDFDALANGEWGDAATLNAWGMNLPAHWGQDVDAVNEQDEWMGMPAFDKEDEGFKIIINCRTEADREAATAAYGLTFTKQAGSAWSCHYPPKERGDLVSLKYE